MSVAHNEGLRERLERRIDELPVLPTVMSRLMMLDHADEAFFEEVLELIEADPTFAARMLSAANAVASSPRSPVMSVRAALARLGSLGASNLILAIAVSRVFIPRDAWEKSLWRHALQVAGAMRMLVGAADEALGINGDEAYAVGLLHDVGRFVMFEEAPDMLREIHEGGWETPDSLIDHERSICGLTHGELGEMACRRWGLPETLGQVVLRHHESGVDSPLGKVEVLLTAVQLADLAMFPSTMPGTPGYSEASLETIEQELMPKVPRGLELSAESLRDIIVTTTKEVDAICGALGLG